MSEDKSYIKRTIWYYARYIYEIYPDVESITIYVECKSGSFMDNDAKKEYSYGRNDKNLFLIPCPNIDCTGIGFDITSEVNSVIREHEKIKKGGMMCKHAESDKIGAKLCMSEIEYTISVVYR